MADIFADHDLLLTPTTRTAAPALGSFDSHGGHPSLCRPWNVTGHPALSVPCGLSPAGLPLAVQIIARPDDDALALRAGHALEHGLSPRTRPPDPEPNARLSAAIAVDLDEDAAIEKLVEIARRAAALLRGSAAFQ